jgi:hypothetical protein
LVHDVIDGYAQGITAGDVHAARDGSVERQADQVRSHQALDDVGDRVVLTRDGVQRRHVDTGDLSLSHTR